MVELIHIYSSRQPFSHRDAFQRQDALRLLQQDIILGAGILYSLLLLPSSHRLYCLDSNSFLLPHSSKRPSTLSSERLRPRALRWSTEILLLESSTLRSLLTDGGFFFERRHSFRFSVAKGAKFVKGTNLISLTLVPRPSNASSTCILLS